MHPEKNQRSKLPVYCLHTGDVFEGPTEIEIRNLNKQKYDSKVEGIKIDLMQRSKNQEKDFDLDIFLIVKILPKMK